MNLGTILNMLGVKVPPDTIKKIEEFIPQVPAKANQLIGAVNGTLQNFDARLVKLERLLVVVEAQQREIMEVIKKNDPDAAGIGHTQLALERGELGPNDGKLGDAGGRIDRGGSNGRG
jgi:hypothetical protein